MIRAILFFLTACASLAATVPEDFLTLRTNVTRESGTILYWNTSGLFWTNAPAGTNGQVLTWTNGVPKWGNATGGSGGGGAGSVTSVGLSTSLSGLTVGSSPVTSSGTMTLSGTLGLGSGGTGATDAPGARTALSLVPGTDVQAYDVELASLAGLVSAADRLPYFTGSGTASLATFTGAGRSVVGAADASAIRTFLTLVIGTDVQAFDADLSAVAGLSSSGLIARTGAGTAAARTITGDSEITVSNGDGASGNPTLAIAAAITRDAEVAAGYQPLDSDLTALAGGTAMATSLTNATSIGAPVMYLGTTNLAVHVGAKAPLASPALTGSPTVPDEAYDATGWNGSFGIPTKNAIRDKIETLGGSAVSVAGTGYPALNIIDSPSHRTSIAASTNLSFLSPTNYVLSFSTTNINTDCSLSTTFRIALTNSASGQLVTPTNPRDGQEYRWVFAQDATGTRLLFPSSGFSWSEDITGSTADNIVSTNANRLTVLQAVYDQTFAKFLVTRLSRGYQ